VSISHEAQQFKHKWFDFKYFIIAFAYHMLEGDDGRSRAKSLYKKAIRRSECPLGAFNMLVSMYLEESLSKEGAGAQATFLRLKME
jgi:hypothetical protein